MGIKWPEICQTFHPCLQYHCTSLLFHISRIIRVYLRGFSFSFPDRPGLEQPKLVEEIQRYYLNTLKTYIVNQHSGNPRCPVIYGKVLSVLAELRTLGMQNSNMCISLKLKNRKLPPFLEEIWDVADGASGNIPIREQAQL